MRVQSIRARKQNMNLRSFCLKIASMVQNKYDDHDFGIEFWDLFLNLFSSMYIRMLSLYGSAYGTGMSYNDALSFYFSRPFLHPSPTIPISFPFYSVCLWIRAASLPVCVCPSLSLSLSSLVFSGMVSPIFLPPPWVLFSAVSLSLLIVCSSFVSTRSASC